MISREKSPDQRDQLRAIALAIHGRETLDIVHGLARSRAFVQRWGHAFRDGGLDAICAMKPSDARSSQTSRGRSV